MGSRASIVCQVKLHDTVVIPAESAMMVEVEIPRSSCLTENGLVEAKPKLLKDHKVIMQRGVIKTADGLPELLVTNPYDRPVKLRRGTVLSTCESYYEEQPTARRCAGVTVRADCSLEDQVPEYLH